jgi:hypothetical protein
MVEVMGDFHCPPGEHITDLIWHFQTLYYCSPDVPGDGLPWDAVTSWVTIGVGILLVDILLFLTYLMIFDRKESSKC